jgi:hypothetical protein
MKKNFYFVCLLAICAGVKAQNVGIGTITPTSKLTVVNAGVGIEHNDGTISLKSVVGGGIAVWGTYSNHPLHLMSNNTTGQLVIMPAGLIGIGNSNPTLAGLVADKKVGAVNAMFGGNTTGVALESNWPGVGFNSYWNGNRKYMADGFGGVIGFNPTNGYFTLASTVVSGTANAAATTTDILTATNTGNVGIGTSTPAAKLEVNGTFKLTDGTQGTGMVLTSDANGNASWKAEAFSGTERFQFSFSQSGTGTPTGITAYNLGTVTYSLSNTMLTVSVTKAGLYHFDLNANLVMFETPTDPETLLLAEVYNSLDRLIGTSYAPYIKTGVANVFNASYDKSIDVYLSAGGSLSLRSFGTSTNKNIKISITGNMIAP